MYIDRKALWRGEKHHKYTLLVGCKNVEVKKMKSMQMECLQMELLSTIMDRGPSNFVY